MAGRASPSPFASHRLAPGASPAVGTIQTVAEQQQLAWACKHDAVVRMEQKPGEFVGMGETVVSVAMARPPDEKMIAALNDAYGMDAFRTLDQDPAFGVRQLVGMALKALSPGINDSTTAETCLDHIGVILACCARRNLKPRNRHDRDGRLRVLSIGIDFRQLTGLACRQAAESAQGNTAVLLRILDTIGRVAWPALERRSASPSCNRPRSPAKSRCAARSRRPRRKRSARSSARSGMCWHRTADGPANEPVLEAAW